MENKQSLTHFRFRSSEASETSESGSSIPITLKKTKPFVRSHLSQVIQVSFVGNEICGGPVLDLPDLAQRPHRVLKALAVGDAVNYQYRVGPLNLIDWEAILVVNWNVNYFHIEQAALQRDGLFIEQVCVWSVFADKSSRQISNGQCCN